jgi:hypothetical protein
MRMKMITKWQGTISLISFHLQARFGKAELLMYGIGAIHVPDKCPQGHVARFRYQTFVQEDETEKFRKKWRKKRDNNKDRPVFTTE